MYFPACSKSSTFQESGIPRFTLLGLTVGILRPQDVDPGEGPLVVMWTGLSVGFVSGALFGAILWIAERRKAIPDLALGRVTIWCMLAAAAWPLLTIVQDSMILILSPLGAVCALAAVASARRVDGHEAERPRLLKWLDRVLAAPLRAVCASDG